MTIVKLTLMGLMGRGSAAVRSEDARSPAISGRWGRDMRLLSRFSVLETHRPPAAICEPGGANLEICEATADGEEKRAMRSIRRRLGLGGSWWLDVKLGVGDAGRGLAGGTRRSARVRT